MGKALGTILQIAVAVFAPYAAAALGLTGFGATLFKFALQGVVGMITQKSSLFGGGGQSGSGGGGGAGSSSDQGLLLNQQGTSNPVYIIYGERRIGANRVFIDTTNGDGGQSGADRDEYLHEAFSICEGEIGWISAMHFQDRIAWIHPDIFAYYNSTSSGDDRFRENNPYFVGAKAYDSGLTYDTWINGQPASLFLEGGALEGEEKQWWGWDTSNGHSKYFEGRSDEEKLTPDGNKLFNLKLWRGTENQTRSNAWFESDSGETWMSDIWLEQNRDAKGIAAAYIRLKYNRDVFSGAPTIQFDVLGKRVRNILNNNTLVSNDTYENAYDELALYTNPANAIQDYLTNTLYGKGLSDNLIDTNSLGALALYTAAKGLDCNGVINPAATIFENTDRLLNTANSYIVNSQGKYVLKPLDALDFNGAYEFNQDNILGEWNIQMGSKKAMMNRVVVNFFNPDENWQQDIYTYPEDDATNPYLIADSNVLNEKTLDLPMVASRAQAEKMGEYILKLSRYQDMVNFKTTWEALKLDVGDPVTITHPTPGWTNKQFRLISMTLNQDGTVDVVLMEYPDTNIWIPNI